MCVSVLCHERRLCTGRAFVVVSLMRSKLEFEWGDALGAGGFGTVHNLKVSVNASVPWHKSNAKVPWFTLLIDRIDVCLQSNR
jgi:hypothetical protein